MNSASRCSCRAGPSGPATGPAGSLPSRIAVAFILNSGIGKLSADQETAAGVHGFVVGAYPILSKL
jgi:hypothetical protein